jgi:peptidyl-prolyl cis-trans isomerase SurA
VGGFRCAASTVEGAEGGDLGTFKAGELTAAFEKAVQGLKEGEVSAVIETPDGFHILRVEERSPGKIRQFDAVQGEIQKAIADQKTEVRFKEWAQNLRKSAYIDIRLAAGTERAKQPNRRSAAFCGARAKEKGWRWGLMT